MIKQLLINLFKNIPSDNFKLPMKGYVSTGSYIADGKHYETFVHPEHRTIQLTVEVDTLLIVNISRGRFIV